MSNNKAKQENQKDNRIGEIRLSNQGCLMKIIEYNNYDDVYVEFQDEFRCIVHTKYCHFLSGGVRNPYFPNVFNVGIVGNKYPAKINGKHTKEYKMWHEMIGRSYDLKIKEKNPTYKNVTCCAKWLLYENFYEWIHSQDNFDKWLDGERWCLDKDILSKGNKIYNPNTCCLVSNNINVLFTKSDSSRGEYPIGVYFHKGLNKFCAQISRRDKTKNKNQQDCLGYYNTPEEAFEVYKKAKESYIKQVAQEEYSKGNITKQCYEAMMNYQVEITD